MSVAPITLEDARHNAKSLLHEIDAKGTSMRPDLSIPGHPEVFVVGDLAALTTNGQPVPAVAPAAMQAATEAIFKRGCIIAPRFATGRFKA